jgi:hypothetical protein
VPPRWRAGGRYNQGLYFATLRKLGATPGTIAGMRRFLCDNGGMAALVAGLGEAGILLQVAMDPPAGVDQSGYVRDAFLALVQDACGNVSFSAGVPPPH